MRPPDGPPISLDFDGFAERLARARPRSVIVLVGAGVSVSAGIPDFRTPGTGLYDNLQEYNLPFPEAIFDINFFLSDPAPFYRLCRELMPGDDSPYAPTLAHRFVRLLHDKGLLLRCFTQNIDSLETAAGLPPSRVVAAHGNFDGAHVVAERAPNAKFGINGWMRVEEPRRVPVDELRAAVRSGDRGAMAALNAKHGGLVKPTITFFGEELPHRFAEQAMIDFPRCELLLVLGTSLSVMPFASLVQRVPIGTPRLLINRHRVGEDLGPNSLDFGGRDEASADVFYQGDCDVGALELARRVDAISCDERSGQPADCWAAALGSAAEAPAAAAAAAPPLTATAKFECMRQERGRLLAPLEAARKELLQKLQGWVTAAERKSAGEAVPASELLAVCEAIHRVDASLPPPAGLRQRRAAVDNWYDDNAPRSFGAFADTLRFARLALSRRLAPGEGGEGGGGGVDDFHVYRSGPGRYRVHANRTHDFCRVGYRFLLTRGEGSWLELEVTESGGRGVGEDKGGAQELSRSESRAGPVLEEGEGAGWGFSVVDECL